MLLLFVGGRTKTLVQNARDNKKCSLSASPVKKTEALYSLLCCKLLLCYLRILLGRRKDSLVCFRTLSTTGALELSV